MSTNKHIAFYKPYGVVCQFSGEGPNLSEFNLPQGHYAAGRLDKDSEGLLILTKDGKFNQRITHPDFEKNKTYWVQVERIPSAEKIKQLESGVKIKGGYITLPCNASIIKLDIPEREPPVRFRKTVPTCWMEIILTEGKNRQVRSMTAAIGHPTLRLIRVQIGKYKLKNLLPGQWQYIKSSDIL